MKRYNGIYFEGFLACILGSCHLIFINLMTYYESYDLFFAFVNLFCLILLIIDGYVVKLPKVFIGIMTVVWWITYGFLVHTGSIRLKTIK